VKKTHITNGATYGLGTILERSSIQLLAIVASIQLSAEGFAQYGQFYIAAQLLAGYATIGMSSLIAKNSVLHKQGVSGRGLAVVVTLKVSVLIALALSLIYISTDGFGTGAITEDFWLVVSVLFLSFSTNSSSYILGREEYRYSLALNVLYFSLITTGALLISYSGAPEKEHFIWVISISLLIISIVNLLKLRKTLAKSTLAENAKVSSIQSWKLIGAEGLPLMLASFATSSLIWLTSAIFLKKAGPEQYAAFLIGLQWAAIATFLPSILTRLVFPSVVRASVDKKYNNDRGELVRNLKLAALSLIPTIFLALIVFLFSNQIDNIYDNKYHGISETIVIYILLSFPGGIVNLFSNQLIAANKTWEWLLSSIAGVTASVYFLYLLNTTDSWAPATTIAAGYIVMIICCLTGIIRRDTTKLK
jgi:O-antigen/teichoic acid export membrane protein